MLDQRQDVDSPYLLLLTMIVTPLDRILSAACASFPHPGLFFNKLAASYELGESPLPHRMQFWQIQLLTLSLAFAS